jgi:AcrR family transcriptional regulator
MASDTIPLIDRALERGEPERDDTRARIMLAGLRQCAEVGLRRTTMEDIARRAGLARVTLYRHFQGKDSLVQAIILDEAERFFEALDEGIAEQPRNEERLVEGFAFALEFTRRHALFQRLLRTEPESLLPYLVGDSYLIAAVRRAVVRRILSDGDKPSLTPDEAERIAELLVRLVLSLALSPESVLPVADADGARHVARAYLVPALHAGEGCVEPSGQRS